MTKGVAVFYSPDQALVADDTFCPRIQGVTVGQAAALCAEHLVMWTPGCERFGFGLRIPSPEVRFFLRGVEIVNPWAVFRPLDPYPIRYPNGQGAVVMMDDNAARLFGATDDK